MSKPNFSAELPETTLRLLDELKPLFNGNKTQIVIQAIRLLHQQEIRSMNTKPMTAQAIYREIYGEIDNKFFKAEKIAEIETWLEEGDPTDDMPALVAEWREYDAEEIEARNV